MLPFFPFWVVTPHAVKMPEDVDDDGESDDYRTCPTKMAPAFVAAAGALVFIITATNFVHTSGTFAIVWGRIIAKFLEAAHIAADVAVYRTAHPIVFNLPLLDTRWASAGLGCNATIRAACRALPRW